MARNYYTHDFEVERNSTAVANRGEKVGWVYTFNEFGKAELKDPNDIIPQPCDPNVVTFTFTFTQATIGAFLSDILLPINAPCLPPLTNYEVTTDDINELAVLYAAHLQLNLEVFYGPGNINSIVDGATITIEYDVPGIAAFTGQPEDITKDSLCVEQKVCGTGWVGDFIEYEIPTLEGGLPNCCIEGVATQFPITGNGEVSNPITLIDGSAPGDTLTWNGSSWTVTSAQEAEVHTSELAFVGAPDTIQSVTAVNTDPINDWQRFSFNNTGGPNLPDSGAYVTGGTFFGTGEIPNNYNPALSSSSQFRPVFVKYKIETVLNLDAAPADSLNRFWLRPVVSCDTVAPNNFNNDPSKVQALSGFTIYDFNNNVYRVTESGAFFNIQNRAFTGAGNSIITIEGSFFTPSLGPDFVQNTLYFYLLVSRDSDTVTYPGTDDLLIKTVRLSMTATIQSKP